jgi:UDP-N-acetylmuramyl pentapeptide phosphotransferase/UDP-N-acetylglucosamine-1-phosphate transferase
VLLVNAYPIFETLFTIWRRLIYKGRNPSIPDGVHFHSLIYRRIMRWTIPKSYSINQHYMVNAKTSPYLWAISSLGVIPATLFWQSTTILMGFTLVFTLIYIYLYRRMVRFDRPRWFI